MPVVPVLDSSIHYLESGSAPHVFLHGNPGSSHSWRDVLPELGGLAPDLIGMGRSGKPDVEYSFADHARYLDAWFDVLELDRVVLVGHDWGGALAFDWAARHPSRVAGIAFFETIVKPMTGFELPLPAQERVRRFRTPGLGEELVLSGDGFIRQAFTGGVRTPVSEEDMAAYLAPFPDAASRRPVLAWARQMPFDREPVELVPRIEAYGEWLGTSEVPKLLVTFENSPTLLIGQQLQDWCSENIAALDVVAVGEAGHHAQEDRPKEIAAAIGAWAEHHGLLA
ncbi:haloalkane dehalogenase [Lentzea flaviverrucosa]|uniref:Haloalkane dehalogenase n=1 Tax=Lentzea flaviverrucosa TaxID=200379 RepID=A0A1H9U655_9PSEU|nr:haloalkane dehalogenase [Lentzea flaviverrucosa]RDI33288.1 haloalkane dehalogenase [Lentzea flaviverrucosa]SES04721.1 haloalkane dehalogenase [Lentzea flaviverrucosa]